MKKTRISKILFDRHSSFARLIENEHEIYGYYPNYKQMRPFFNHLEKINKKILNLDKKNSKEVSLKLKNTKKKIRYDLGFIDEMIVYTNKIFANGCYYSTTFLKSLTGPDRRINSQLRLFKHVQRSIDCRIDTLMGFTIMRARLEEMILNLFFIFKAKNMIKEKRWYDLFVLIHRINYSNYENEIGLKIRPHERKFQKIILNKILKKNNKLHVSEMTKFVVRQKNLIDDFHPDFYMTEDLNTIFSPNKKMDKKELLKMKRFHEIYKRENKDSMSLFSMKPINEIYSLLSDQLHPNSLFLRNIMTLSKNNMELTIILKDHIEKLLYCNTYITDTYEIIYKQTLGILEFFVSKIDGSEKDKDILDGFRQQVKNKFST